MIATLFPCILTACTTPRVWQVDTAEGGYCRLRNRVDNTYRGIQLELLSKKEERQAYFNVFCIPLAPTFEEELTTVFLAWGDEQREARLPLLLGGQRILLPNDLAEEILCALKNDFPVEVCVGRYRSLIPAYNP